MTNPPLPFLGSKWRKLDFFYHFFVGGTDIQIMKIGFLAFFEAKMTKIDILTLKLIVPDDYYYYYYYHYYKVNFHTEIQVLQFIGNNIKVI